jgi:hypothetical protein
MVAAAAALAMGSASAQAGGIVSLAPVSLDFGSVTVGSIGTSQTVTLTNAGTTSLTLSGEPVLAGANAAQFTLSSGTCTSGTTLAANGTCKLSVQFTPSAAGALVARIDIADDAPGSPQHVQLAGTGVTAAPAASLSLAALDFGSVTVGSISTSQTVTLTNAGNAPLTLSANPVLAGTNPTQFTLSSGTCTSGTTLAVNGTCKLSVQFSPSATGALVARIDIADNAIGSPQRVQLAGTGVAATPAATLSLAALDFGSVTVGSISTSQTVTLTNSGNAPLTLSGDPVLAGANVAQFSLSSGTCTSGTTLAINGTCKLSVQFSPSATGALVARIDIADDAAGSPQRVQLAGTGVAATPAAVLSLAALDFGSVTVGGISTSQTVTITNSGNSPLTLSADPVLAGAHAAQFSLSSGTCTNGTTLAINGTCKLSVQFSPTSTGPLVARIDVSDNAPGSPHRVQLAGTGVGAAPAASLSLAALDFGSVAVGSISTSQTVTLTNAGNSPLTLSADPVLVGAHAAQFSLSSGTCTSGTTLAINGTCKLSVQFSPSSTGPVVARIDIADNAAGSPQRVQLAGTGINGSRADAAPLSIDLGTQPVGAIGIGTPVVLTNSGTSDLHVVSVSLIGADPDDFVLSADTCTGATLSPLASCSIIARFAPTSWGSKSASIRFTDDASGAAAATQSTALSGTGVASLTAPSPIVTGSRATARLSLSKIVFAPRRVRTTVTGRTVTLVNTGDANLTITAKPRLSGAGAASFKLVANSCSIGRTIAPGMRCSVKVYFQPSKTGRHSATVMFTSNTTDPVLKVQVMGQATTSS